jgi:MFS family permease
MNERFPSAAIPNDSRLKSNFYHLYLDILGFGVMSGSVLTFLSIYGARMGANGLQLSLLTAGPALVNLAFSLPTGRWLERRPLTRSVFIGALFNRLGYLGYLLVPWLLNSSHQISGIITVTVLMAIPATLLTIGFNSLFADVVPPDWRGEVVGKRNAIMAVSQTITTLLCGQILDRIIFPLNYEIVLPSVC